MYDGAVPQTLGDVTRKTKDVLARNWQPLFGVALAVSVVSQLLALPVRLGFQHDLRATLVDRHFESGDLVRDVIAAGTTTLLVTIISLVLGLAVTAVTIVVVHAEVAGTRVTPRVAIEAAAGKLGRLVAMTLLLCAVAFAAFLVVFVVLLGSTVLGAPLAAACLVACVYFAVLFAFATAAIVVEDAAVIAALRRSMALVTGQWWRVFGIVLLAEFVFGVPASLPGLFLRDWLASAIVDTIRAPTIACAITLRYFDSRFRKGERGYAAP